LRCQTILAHAVSVNPERSSDVAVAEHVLHRLEVRPFPNEEARQAMTQVVEPEADLLALLEHTHLHRSRTEVIFDQHVRDAGLLPLPLSLLPFTLVELNARLLALIAFGIDIFVLRDGERIRLWKHAAGYDSGGLDYIISLRGEHYLRQREERKLKSRDRVALLGRGIAVVKQADEKEAGLVLGNGELLRVARRDIVLSLRNQRWECAAKPQLLRS